MLLVLFGAGASYDSVPHRRPPGNPDRPPLANELFEDRAEFVQLMARFDRCRQIIPFLRKDGVAVEKELAKIQHQAANWPPAYSELAAILYYIRYAIYECEARWRKQHSGITNYVTLLREIDLWRHERGEQVLLVTFNYDTMLESAMAQVLGSKFDVLDDYISQPPYRLIKLHGSTNWARVVHLNHEPYTEGHDIVQAQRRVISDGRMVTDHLSDGFEIMWGPDMLLFKDQLVFPAIALPIDKKDEFSCPQNHVTALAQVIPEVKNVLIIGWRATEEKFLDMLAAPLTGLKDGTQLMIISGTSKDGGKTFENLGSRITQRCTPSIMGQGFSGLIMNNLEEMTAWLRSGKKAAAV